jgi:hypothetical protein
VRSWDYRPWIALRKYTAKTSTPEGCSNLKYLAECKELGSKKGSEGEPSKFKGVSV